MNRWLCSFTLAAIGMLTSTASAQSFYAPHDYGLPTRPDAIKVADVNHDGHADILALDNSAGSMTVEINNLDGTFHTGVTVQVGAGPVALDVADFNGDGKLDVAVATRGSSNVSVLLGNGDGTFQAAKSYHVDGAPNSITVADFNGDGRRDIATISDVTDKVSILTNTGSGFTLASFAAPQYFPSQYGGGFTDQLTNIVSGDFNGDRHADLAYVDRCGTSDCIVSQEEYFVLINTGASWSPAMVGSNTGTIDLRAYDVDNDGRSDLVDTYYGCYHEPCTGVDVFYSNMSSTNSTFSRVPVVQASGIGGDPTGNVVMADFNNDGIMDLAATVSGGNDPVTNAPIQPGFAIYTGKAGRAFNAAKYFAAKGTQIGEGFISSDGRADVVTADSSGKLLEVRKNAFVSSNDPCSYPNSAGLHFCSPATSATATASAVKFSAAAHALSQPVIRLELWVDGKKVFQTSDDRLSKTLSLSKGAHSATVSEVDATNHVVKVTHSFTAN